ncbi:hypothetical protein DV738_g3262, partial [Chaetothyriales sp. CBS 135597]
MSTINIVKYYFHGGNPPASEQRLRQLVALAYRTARDREIYPHAVFIRSDVHDTTRINGRYQKDPLGAHVTFSYKSRDHLGRETHVTAHGYVKDRKTLEFRESTHMEEKSDSILLGSGKYVWPGPEDLWEAPDVGYSHMPEK